MAGALVEFWSGGSTREVLLLVPELIFFAFTAVVALDSTFAFVASLLSDRRSHLKQERKASGEARLRRPLAAAQQLSVVGAATLAATVVLVLPLSLKVVLEAPVKVVIMAAAASAATVVAAVVASVAVVVTVSVTVGASGLVLARICQRYQESK